PLFPPGAIFHCKASSKLANSSSVIRSSPSPTRVIAPSTTFQPSGTPSFLNPRQPFVVEPSKRSRQPSCFSLAVSILGFSCAQTGADGSDKASRSSNEEAVRMAESELEVSMSRDDNLKTSP